MELIIIIIIIIIILIGIGILIFAIDNMFYFKTTDDKIDELIKKGVNINTLIKEVYKNYGYNYKIAVYKIMIINRKVYALKIDEKEFYWKYEVEDWLKANWKYDYISFKNLQEKLIKLIQADKIDSIQIHYLKGK